MPGTRGTISRRPSARPWHWWPGRGRSRPRTRPAPARGRSRRGACPRRRARPRGRSSPRRGGAFSSTVNPKGIAASAATAVHAGSGTGSLSTAAPKTSAASRPPSATPRPMERNVARRAHDPRGAGDEVARGQLDHGHGEREAGDEDDEEGHAGGVAGRRPQHRGRGRGAHERGARRASGAGAAAPALGSEDPAARPVNEVRTARPRSPTPRGPPWDAAHEAGRARGAARRRRPPRLTLPHVGERRAPARAAPAPVGQPPPIRRAARPPARTTSALCHGASGAAEGAATRDGPAADAGRQDARAVVTRSTRYPAAVRRARQRSADRGRGRTKATAGRLMPATTGCAPGPPAPAAGAASPPPRPASRRPRPRRPGPGAG